jgi:hypothetical protein
MKKIMVASLVLAGLLAGSGGGVAAAGSHAAGHAKLQPTLGSKKVFSGHGSGWGTVKPKLLSNDTDCTGAITDIHWSSWGGKTAKGRGKTCLNGETGGTVTIKLEPSDLRTCAGASRKSYTRLLVQFPKAHGGYTSKKLWWGIKNLCKRSKSVSYG